MSEIHHHIKHERKLSHLTQEDIAYLSGTGEHTRFSKLESGTKKMDIEAMVIYHFLFDIPFIEFCKEKRQQLKQTFVKKAPILLDDILHSETNPRNIRRKDHIIKLLKRYQPAYDR